MSYVELLQHNSMLYLLIIAVLGLLVGSFLNVVIYRLPIMLKRQWKADCELFLSQENAPPPEPTVSNESPFNLVTPRSRCPHCGHLISALENVPVISYLFLQGRCRECRTPISLRYPMIEILSATMVVVVAWNFGFSIQAAMGMLLSWSLICLCFIDYDHQYLPDNITLPFLWLGLFLNLNGVYVDLASAVMGAMLGYLVLWLVYQVFKKLTGKEGMGYGDFKLLAMLGAWLGWQALPAIILISTLVGSIAGISLILFKQHNKSHPIPFGPYLAIAGWLVLLWGDDINNAYLNWINL